MTKKFKNSYREFVFLVEEEIKSLSEQKQTAVSFEEIYDRIPRREKLKSAIRCLKLSGNIVNVGNIKKQRYLPVDSIFIPNCIDIKEKKNVIKLVEEVLKTKEKLNQSVLRLVEQQKKLEPYLSLADQLGYSVSSLMTSISLKIEICEE